MTIDKECCPSHRKRRLRSSGMTDSVKVAGLMKPFDSRLMRLSDQLDSGQSKNDGPECAEESAAVTDGQDQTTSF
jgi:hypothetical protein